MLDPFAQLFQHCGSHALALHIVSEVLWVVPFPVERKDIIMRLLAQTNKAEQKVAISFTAFVSM